MSFKVFGERFTVAISLDFLRRSAAQQTGRPAFVIVDRHSVHKAKKVEEWLATQDGKVRLFFMPPYSPELNPDKLVNQDVKSNALRGGRAADKAELMTKTRSFMRSRQRQPEKEKRYFDGKYVAYAKTS